MFCFISGELFIIADYAMIFSVAIVCRLSVRLSVRL